MKYLLVAMIIMFASSVFGQAKVEPPAFFATGDLGYFSIAMENFDKIYEDKTGVMFGAGACMRLVVFDSNRALYVTVAWEKFGKTGDMVFEDMSAANVDDGGCARDVTISSNETIFLANGWDGLRAYTYSNSGGF